MIKYERGFYEQVKVFTHYDRNTLEKQINDWLAVEKVKVLELVATDSGGSNFTVICRYLDRL